MQYHLNSRKEVEDFLLNEVLTTAEAAELLEVSRMRVSQLISEGKLNPIRKSTNTRTSWFLRADVEARKRELEAEKKK